MSQAQFGLAFSKDLEGSTHAAAVADYLSVEGEIPLDLKSGSFISVNRSPALKIYLLGFQPAKSIPEIARWVLNKYCSRDAAVLDPFCGSGTTLIEALRCGMSVWWLDYNPLSRLICQAKTQAFPRHLVLGEATRILLKVASERTAPCGITFANRDFWFQQPVREALELLRKYILLSSPAVQPLLWLSFASTVRKTSDMNDGMILAAKRSHVEKIPTRTRQDVFDYFEFYIQKALEAVDEWRTTCGHAFHKAHELPITDARDLSKIHDTKFDAIITSPPYINAIDYVWASKFELHWLGLVDDDADRLALYAKEIGTERFPRSETRQLGKTGHTTLDQLIEDIYTGKRYRASPSQNHLRARTTYKYFLDMKRHFADCFSVLQPGGILCFTIGDTSKICGVEIPVAQILTEFAQNAGFIPMFDFHLLLKNRRLNLPRNLEWAGTIKHDTTVVLKRSGSPKRMLENVGVQ